MRQVKNLLYSVPFLLLLIQVSTFMIPWLIVLWLSHSAGASAVGQFSYILAVLSPICILLASPSRNFMLSKSEHDINHIASLRFILIALGIIFAFIYGSYEEQLAFVLAIYLFKVTELLFDLPIATAIKSAKSKSLFFITVGKWASIILAAICAYFTRDIVAAMLVLALCFVVFGSGIEIRNLLLASPQHLWRLLKSTMPLSMSALTFSVYFNIPRYIMGEEEVLLSVFTVSSFLVAGTLVVVNTMVQARLHKLREAFENKDKSEFIHHFKWCISIALGLFALLQVGHVDWFHEIFWALHNDIHLTEGDLSYIYTWVLLLSVGPILFSVANYLYMASGKHKLLLFFTAFNTVVLYTLGTIFYVQYGFVALMWLILFSAMLQFVVGFMSFSFKKVE